MTWFSVSSQEFDWELARCRPDRFEGREVERARLLAQAESVLAFRAAEAAGQLRLLEVAA